MTRVLGRRLTATAVTAVVVGAAVMTGGPAAAASSYYGLEFYATGAGTCTVTEPNKEHEASVAGGLGGSMSDTDTRLVSSGGTVVGGTNSSSRLSFAVSTRAGGLAAISVDTSGSTGAYRTTAAATCADASQRVMSTNAQGGVKSTQLIGGAGWLDLATSTGAGTPVLKVTVYDPAGHGQVVVPETRAASTRSRVFLPAGNQVSFEFSAGSGVTLLSTTTTQLAATWSASLRGVVTPIGWAFGAQAGKATARRAVMLPAAASCSGSAKVALTKYAKKKARSVKVLVNGKTRKRISRIKRKAYAVKVPRRGGITIKATVTFKSGKKATTTRTYAPCS